MLKAKIIISAILCSFLSGCCSDKRVEPSYPNITLGWQEQYEKGVHVMGNFVLKKGESTSNGKVAIQLMDIVPPKSCASSDSYASMAKVKLRFINTLNQQVLCEAEVLQGSTVFGAPTFCGAGLRETGLSAVYIHAINIKDAWVYFTLAE